MCLCDGQEDVWKEDVWKRIRLLGTCEGSMWPRGVSLKAIRGVEYGAKKERAKQWSRYDEEEQVDACL